VLTGLVLINPPNPNPSCDTVLTGLVLINPPNPNPSLIHEISHVADCLGISYGTCSIIARHDDTI